jgi:hypothetical protein
MTTEFVTDVGERQLSCISTPSARSLVLQRGDTTPKALL